MQEKFAQNRKSNPFSYKIVNVSEHKLHKQDKKACKESARKRSKEVLKYVAIYLFDDHWVVVS